MFNLDKEARRILESNRWTTKGFQYTIPSHDTYPYQWLWDSCFHAIVLSHFSLEDAKKELISLVSHQFEDGMLPHMIYWVKAEAIKVDWGKNDTSTITQPPILAYAVQDVYERTSNKAFLEEIYPSMMRFYRYLVTKRDPLDHNLAGIINPDESGEDNSPRFDKALNVPFDISNETHFRRRLELVEANKACNFEVELCTSKNFWVKDVPFNVFLVENLKILGSLASLLGRTEDAEFCTLNAGLMTEAMREYMFEDGVFWSVMDADHEKIRVETWAHFAPLFAGLYTQEEAKTVVPTHFHNPKTFYSPFGIRTVSMREESYSANGFWRGPIWMSIHWFIYHGLLRYGFTAEAEDILKKSVKLLELSGFREYYNPETGEGYGAKDFTWGALVLDMMEK